MTAGSNSDWITATGVQPSRDDGGTGVLLDRVLADPDLSLMAKGLFALLLEAHGAPVNPYEDAYEDPHDIAGAIDELINRGLAVRV